MVKVILFLSMITWLYSVPAYQGAIKFKQNDGSTFSGKLKGDEWFNWVEDEQGDITGVADVVNGEVNTKPIMEFLGY